MPSVRAAENSKPFCNYATILERETIWTLADIVAADCRTRSACQRSLPHRLVYRHYCS